LDRSVRSLAELERSASTARVLNLNAISKRGPETAESDGSPLFHNALLNRSIIIKHRLRRDEQDLFADYRLIATKVILPIDNKDLAAGAHYFFVGQRGHVEMLNNLLGANARFGTHDRMVLQLLDESPTLDPFVLREQLRRHGLEPSPQYFEIGVADLNRMQTFVVRQVEPLATLTSDDRSRGAGVGAVRLARKLLSSKAEVETEPLRATLKLDVEEYKDGVFCWKGFLYYKWCLDELTPHMAEVVRDISRTRLRGKVTPKIRALLDEDRAHLRRALIGAYESVQATMGIYDKAYSELVVRHDPAPFRKFLLGAPALFAKLGRGLGAIQHVVSYWSYRFPPTSDADIEPTELSEILEDFLQCLEPFDRGPDDGQVDIRDDQVVLI
jgi:hypothetical protein